jgi:membrane associated rhomboid family serine protease
MCLLYTMFALKKHAEDGMTGRDPWLAGLDSIKRGSTDLRWAGPECEDYRGQVWRWITYQFTHVGVGHIFANCLLLVVFGTALEGHEGSVRMFLLWNAGVVAGALCWFVGGAHGCVVGSSAGVYSLVGVQFEDLIMNWRERHFHWCALFVLLAYALLDAVTWLWSMDLQKVDYSYSIAVGGGLAGLIIGSFMGRNYVMTRKDKLLISGLSLLGVALTLFALIWLGTHETPVSIWEAGAGEDGWCWVGQFYGRRINATSWQCVRCATKECIEEWTTRRNMAPVSVSACEAQGWYYDER